MRLEGLDGGQLLGFMAAIGSLAALDDHARIGHLTRPGLGFDADRIAVLRMPGLSEADVVEAVHGSLQRQRGLYEADLSGIKRPADFTPASLAELARVGSRALADVLAGLVCAVGDEVFESTLCAANGASHQHLIQSMRDVLTLVQSEHLRRAMFGFWLRDYDVPDEARKSHELGSRKPTLRLDPSDERLYALRFSNPTTASDFRTELGAQALAIPAFSVLPIVPRARPERPRCVASTRFRNRAVFSWPLWEPLAGLDTVKSLLAVGVERSADLRARGAFAAFRAARVSGDKGKLSFAPTEGVW